MPRVQPVITMEIPNLKSETILCMVSWYIYLPIRRTLSESFSATPWEDQKFWSLLIRQTSLLRLVLLNNKFQLREGRLLVVSFFEQAYQLKVQHHPLQRPFWKAKRNEMLFRENASNQNVTNSLDIITFALFVRTLINNFTSSLTVLLYVHDPMHIAILPKSLCTWITSFYHHDVTWQCHKRFV